jgi:hypothetical protein
VPNSGDQAAAAVHGKNWWKDKAARSMDPADQQPMQREN